MKHEPFEHEEYESPEDRIILVAVVVTLIISITIILWTPDVEAIGEWVYNFIN